MTLDLRPHQEEAVKKMHNGCILCGGVGVGKSHTAVGYYLENEAPKPVYVITTAKKRDKGDWQTLWAEVGMHKDPELTMGAVVTVDSWENIQRYKEVENAFFIFDEQRLVGSGAWVKAFYDIAKHNRWIMLSATPGDNWLDYVPVFRANGFIKNITQFKEDHVVQRWTGRYHQVVGYRQVPKLVRWRNSLLVDMPYEKHTTRHSHDVLCTYDVATIKEMVKNRWHVYENRPLTDASELFRVMRKVVYTDESRLHALRTLLTNHPKLIVFYNFDYELEILRSLTSAKELGSSGNDSDATKSPLIGTSDFLSDTTPTSGAPWEYLLSPVGMMENETLVTQNGATRLSTSTTSSSGSEQTESHIQSSDTRSETRSTTPETSQSLETEKTLWTKNDSPPEKSSNKSLGQSQQSSGGGSRTSASGIPSLEENNPSPTSTKATSPLSSGTSTQTSRSTLETTSGKRLRPSKSQSPTTSGSSVPRKRSESESSSEKNSSSTSGPTFAVAEWNGHKHQEIPKTDSWVYLVQYVAGAEAWECIDTDAICFYSMPYSYKLWWQAHGRIDRLHTSFLDLHYYTLISEAPIDLAVKASLKEKKSFNESAFVEMAGLWQK